MALSSTFIYIESKGVSLFLMPREMVREGSLF